MQPTFDDDVMCPHCKSKAVLLKLVRKDMPVDDKVYWCVEGHVTVQDSFHVLKRGDAPKHLVAYDFKGAEVLNEARTEVMCVTADMQRITYKLHTTT